MKTSCGWGTVTSLAVVVGALVGRVHPAVGQGSGPKDAALVGRWESVARSQGGIGTTMEFAPGGILVASIGVLVDTTYSVTGDTAVIEAGPGQEVRYVFRGDTLMMQGGTVGVPLRRVTALEPGVPRLVGQWSLAASDSMAAANRDRPDRAVLARAMHRFSVDGRYGLRIPFRSDTGSYRLSADTLVIIGSAASGAGEQRVRYTVSDSMLTLVPIAEGPSGQFRRAP